MVEVYVTLVIYGKKDISQVPDRYRDAVVKMLGVLDGEEI